MLNTFNDRDMQIKTTMRYHYMPTRMAMLKRPTIVSVHEGMKKLEPSYIADGTVQW